MTELVLKRLTFTDKSTMGELWIDGVQECFTLEDTCRRDVNKDGILQVAEKIPGRTAIPSGRYRLVIDFSNRFKRYMPHLLNVPFFEGVRIHAGNTDEDTHGCILVGSTPGEDRIYGSREAFMSLMTKLEKACRDGDVFISILGGLSADHKKAA